MSEAALPLLDALRKLEEHVAAMRKGILALEAELSEWKRRALSAENEKVKAETEIKDALQVLTDFLKDEDLANTP